MQSGGPAILFSYSASLYHSWVHCCCIKSLFFSFFFVVLSLWQKREKSKRKKPTTSHTNNTGGNCVTQIHKTLQLFTCFFKISIILSRRMAASLFFSSIIQQFAAICKNHKNTSITKNLTLLLNIHLCKKPNKSFQNSDTWRNKIPGKRVACTSSHSSCVFSQTWLMCRCFVVSKDT